MLSLQTFEKTSKNELYNIYRELYEKLQEKEKIIEQHVINISNYLKGTATNNTPQASSTTSTSGYNVNKVRSFQAFPVKDNTTNLIIGSSIVKNLVNDRSFPADVEVHAYRGSTTLEKLQILEQYDQKKMKTVVLQDGSNAILKNKSCSLDIILENFAKLVHAVNNKFQPDSLVIMQTPPVKNSQFYTNVNKKISDFNQRIRSLFNDVNFTVKFLNVHDFLISLPSYENFYYDDIHFNYQQGVPYLKNAILSHVLLTSDNIICNSMQRNNSFSSTNYRYYSNNYRHRNNFNQSYNYMRGFKY